jgi:pilus assembly protein CpaB
MTRGRGDRVGRATRLRDLGRAMLWHRRLLAASLTAAAVAAGLTAVAPEPPPTVSVVAAARDLPGGAALRAQDLQRVALAPSSVPAGALTDPSAAVGRRLAGPIRRKEALTDVRLVSRELLSAYGGTGDDRLVATPVRVADADTAGLLRPGDVVDVLAADTGEGGTDTAEVVAAAVRVLSVPSPASDGSLGGAVPGLGGAGPGLSDGALIVLATSTPVAARLARAAVSSRLSVTLRTG